MSSTAHSVQVTPPGTTVILDIPFRLTLDQLHIEPGTGGDSIKGLMRWMLDSSMPDESIERVMRGAECLFATKKGTFAQCLETALIWECG